MISGAGMPWLNSSGMAKCRRKSHRNLHWKNVLDAREAHRCPRREILQTISSLALNTACPLDQILATEPGDLGSLVMQAALLTQTGRLTRARALTERGLTLDTTDEQRGELYFRLARIAVQEKGPLASRRSGRMLAARR